MKNYVKVENSEYVRDMESKAILNTDVKGLNNFNLQRNRILKQKQEIESTSKRLDNLEKNVDEIKELLKILAANKEQK